MPRTAPANDDLLRRELVADDAALVEARAMVQALMARREVIAQECDAIRKTLMMEKLSWRLEKC